MKVRSVRIPEEIDKAIDYVARSEKIEKTSSLRKLTRMGFEVYVARTYEKGKISLREAADLLQMNLIEAIDLLNEMGVKGNIKAKDVMNGLMTLPENSLDSNEPSIRSRTRVRREIKVGSFPRRDRKGRKEGIL